MDSKVVPLFRGAPDALKSNAEAVGAPYLEVTVAPAPGAPAMAVGYPLEHLSHPERSHQYPHKNDRFHLCLDR